MSIRLRLILILLLATTVVWVSAIVWIEHSTRARLEQMLDARLSEAARMVSSLLSDHRIEVAQAAGGMTVPVPAQTDYARQLSCQIWSLQGSLVGQSSGAPEVRLTDAPEPGFSYSTVNGEPWRVYTVVNTDLGVSVMVGDSVGVRNRLMHDVIEAFLIPAAIVLPLLAMLIWFGVARGLSPLERLAGAVQARSPSDLSPLPADPAPPEIAPLRDALNTLFRRVETSRQTERDFTSFAAHELKTPLAGLKTQAQIARMARDDATRDHALAEIQTSVMRTDRLVRQLLELTALETGGVEDQRVDLTAIVQDVAEELAPLAKARGIALVAEHLAARDLRLPRFLLNAALRNVVENAIQASPDGGSVRIRAECDTHRCRIAVTDAGPGISEKLRDQVTHRFVRGTVGGTGSGLGLSIVAVAVERLQGQLDLPPADADGQTVVLTLPRGATAQ